MGSQNLTAALVPLALSENLRAVLIHIPYLGTSGFKAFSDMSIRYCIVYASTSW